MLQRLGLPTESLRRRGACGSASRTSTRTSAAPRPDGGRGRPAGGDRRAARACSPSAACGSVEGVETTAIDADGDAAPRRAPTRGEFARARRSWSPPGTAPTTCWRCCRAARLQVPITKDRPSEAKYFVPPAGPSATGSRGRDAGDRLPGRRHLLPPDRRRPRRRGEDRLLQPAGRAARDARRIDGIAALRRAVHARPARRATVRDVEDVDQCDYDLVADDEFVLGAVPGSPNAFVGVGWRGTGYKFAPVGRARAVRAARCRAAPSTTSPASTRPASRQEDTR